MNEITIHNSWVVGGDTLYLESRKGKYKSPIDGWEDRLFFIRINNSERFPLKHLHQMELMESILLNDLYPSVAVSNCEKFLHKIYEIKGKIKAKFRKGNLTLPSWNRSIWNCGGVE